MLTPEQQARATIDQLLQTAGWLLQSKDSFNRNAGLGVAVREFQLTSGACDYLLFVDGRAAGVIEAKKAGVTLSGVAEQSARYMSGLPQHLARWHDHLVYDYCIASYDYELAGRLPLQRAREILTELKRQMADEGKSHG